MRLNEPSRNYYLQHLIAMVFYAGMLSLYVYATIFKLSGNNSRSDVHPSVLILKKYKFCFCTTWNILFQLTFLTVATIDTLATLLKFPIKLQKQLHGFRAILFNGIVVPFTFLVVIVFWTVWAVDRELIFPKALDEFLPTWVNHTIHTAILGPVLIEFLLPKKYAFVTSQRVLKVASLSYAAYELTFFIIYFKEGIWLYPIYKIMNWPVRIVLTIAGLGVVSLFTYTGIQIQNSKHTANTRQKVK